MAVTLTERIRSALTNRRFNAVRFTLGDYATDGIPVTANDFGMSRIESMIVTAPGLNLTYVPTDERSGVIFAEWIPALDGNAAAAQVFAEVDDEEDLSGVTATAHIVGRG